MVKMKKSNISRCLKPKGADPRYYAAYGSNLNLEQMARRCPGAKALGTAVLHGWRLVFYSVATIERYKGGKVPVLIWEIQPQDEQALDRYEGWPHLYRKETLRVRLNGRYVRAMAYLMNTDGRNYSVPDGGYLETIREGYVSADFDREILLRAVEETYELMKEGKR